MRNYLTILGCLLLPYFVFSQEIEPDTTKPSEIDLPEIIVLAEDLESDNQSQQISGLLQSSNDIFVSTAGYVFGQTRFKIRGFDSENTDIMINGIPVNDRETGGAY
jgi:outer membrane receptor for ferrienterochelin and colicin